MISPWALEQWGQGHRPQQFNGILYNIQSNHCTVGKHTPQNYHCTVGNIHHVSWVLVKGQKQLAPKPNTCFLPNTMHHIWSHAFHYYIMACTSVQPSQSLCMASVVTIINGRGGGGRGGRGGGGGEGGEGRGGRGGRGGRVGHVSIRSSVRAKRVLQILCTNKDSPLY